MTKHKDGVFLARMQPLHNAHLWVIEKMIKECDNVYIILGSENKVDMLRNPFDISLREQILKESISNFDKIEIYTLPDWTMETDVANAKEWGMYLYYNVVSRIQNKKFAMYYSDEPEVILNWFDSPILERITFELIERSNVFDGLSATKIRKAFENDDFDYIKKYCPKSVISRYKELKDIWFDIKKNPKSDFSM